MTQPIDHWRTYVIPTLTSEDVKPLAALPLVLRWGGDHEPLPQRTVRVPAQTRRRTLGLEAPPWLTTGPTDQPFDFTAHVRRLCADLTMRCDEFRHIDVSRLLFGM